MTKSPFGVKNLAVGIVSLILQYSYCFEASVEKKKKEMKCLTGSSHIGAYGCTQFSVPGKSSKG